MPIRHEQDSHVREPIFNNSASNIEIEEVRNSERSDLFSAYNDYNYQAPFRATPINDQSM